MKLTVKYKKGAGFSATPAQQAAVARLAAKDLARRAPSHLAAWIGANKPFQDRSGRARYGWGAIYDHGAVRVWSTVPYTYWLDQGSKPYTRAPEPGKLLRLPWGVRQVTEKSLALGHWQYPGRPATHFFQQALQDLLDYMAERYPSLVFHLEPP